MRFYLSHSIRGKYGAAATPTQTETNCNKAILIANMIRNAIPSINVYCPGEHENFVTRAYRREYMTEKQILVIDCDIIDICEGVIIYIPEGDTLQGGRKVEHDYALAHSKPVFVFSCVEDIINRLAEYILRV